MSAHGGGTNATDGRPEGIAGLVGALASAPPFSYMRPEDVGAFARAGRPAEYQRDQRVYNENQDATAVMVVLDGQVCICTYEAEGRQVIEAVVPPPESFGWFSLVDPGPRSIGAVVRGRTRLLVINRRDVLAILDASPGAWQAVARFLASRLRRTLASQRALAGYPLDRRIAFVLCQSFRVGSPDGIPLVELRLTQEDVASMTASSRQSVNRRLKAWERRGIVAVGYQTLRVLDGAALQGIAFGTLLP